MVNPFFKNNGPLKISEVINVLNLKFNDLNKDQEVNGIYRFDVDGNVALLAAMKR